jgi:pimeloyl-ACP methyl ester carboxylesterase
MATFSKEQHTINGCKIMVQRGGRGEPLLYLHGAGVVSTVVPFMEHLARSFDLIVPQHPGYGESDMPPWLGSMRDMALYYHDFMDHFRIRDVHVVGTSIGGWIAATVAYVNPMPLKTLTLVCAGGLSNPAIPRPSAMPRTQAETMRLVLYDQALAEQMIARLPANTDDNPVNKKNRATSQILAGESRHDPDMPKWLHRIRAPVHIVWGKDDRFTPVGYADEFKKHLPAARVTLIDKCGHLPYTEHPQLYAEAITRFCIGHQMSEVK